METENTDSQVVVSLRQSTYNNLLKFMKEGETFGDGLERLDNTVRTCEFLRMLFSPGELRPEDIDVYVEGL